MIKRSLDFGVDDDLFVSLAHKIREKAQHDTNFNTYVSKLNISLNLHLVYVSSEYILHQLRESFARIHLMSYNLKIEAGK